MNVVSAGKYLFTFTDGGTRPAGCAFATDSQWSFDWPSKFPGTTPVKAAVSLGWPNLSVLVLDGANKLWRCGVPSGEWTQDITEPDGFTIASFLGAGDVYIAILDTNGNAWLIGNATGTGVWVQAPNLRPPA